MSNAKNSRLTIDAAMPTQGAPGAPDTPVTTRSAKAKKAPSRGTKQAGRQAAPGAQGRAAAGSDVPGPAARVCATPTTIPLLDPALAFAADILDDIENVRKANENRLRQMTRSVEDKDGEVRGLGYDESHPDVAWMASLVELIGKAEHQAELNLERQLRRHAMYPWIRDRWTGGRKQIARLLASIGDPYWRPEWVKADGTVVPEGPRTVSALWAYCGLHVLPAGHARVDTQGHDADRNQLPDGRESIDDQPAHAVGGKHRDTNHATAEDHLARVGVAAKRQRNQQSNWNETARMRVWNVADKAKQAGFDSQHCVSMTASETGFAVHGEGCGCKPYRLVYDAARAKYADAVHSTPCVRCGPKGKPAEVGSALSDAHKNARAVRIVMKEILKDLWREAKRIHEAHGGSGLAGVGDQHIRAGAVVPESPVGHSGRGTQSGCAGRNQLPDGQSADDAHAINAVGANRCDTDQAAAENHMARVGVAAKSPRTRKAAA